MNTRWRFDDGWLFHLGELASPPVRRAFKSGASGGLTDCVGDERGALAAPDTGSIIAPELPAFHKAQRGELRLGAGWVEVELPHDWRIEQDYVRDPPTTSAYPHLWQGFLPVGVAYYRKTFQLPATWCDTVVHLEFDGVMRASSVWVNGHHLYDHPSGYSPFRVEISDVARCGDEGDNVVMVRCDTSEAEGWWGEGAGIYRHVWLASRPRLHIAPDGIWIRPRPNGDGTWSARVDVTLRSADDVLGRVSLALSVADPTGAVIAARRAEVACEPAEDVIVPFEVAITDPQPWDVTTPQLYRLTIDLHDGESVLQQESLTFGLRTAEFTPDGFFLNGRRLQIWGANVHQDFAGLGMAVTDSVIRRKLELLREMGCNTVRTAHHPVAPAFLDTCDELGILVLAENRHLATDPQRLRELEELVTRARHHPSVIAWCLEDEEFLEGTPTGTRLLKRLVRTVRRLDPGRATTVAGYHNLDRAEYYDVVDVYGCNYQSRTGAIDRRRAMRPGQPVLATEEGLHPTTRGALQDDARAGRLSEYGTRVPPLDAPDRPGPDDVWDFHASRPDIAGALVWSGFDYRGEPFPLAWPAVLSQFGAMDYCGFPKAYYWLLRSFFRPEPLVHVVPHWTWPGPREVEVRVYTNCDEVELTLNGRIVGRPPVRKHSAVISILYEPGTLVARGLRAGVEVARHSVETVGPPVAVRLSPDRAAVSADRQDIVLIAAAVVDEAGRVVPQASDWVDFTVAGGGKVVGVGNGDPSDHSPDRAARRRAFQGRALALVSPPEADTTLEVVGRAPGLAAGIATVRVQTGTAA